MSKSADAFRTISEVADFLETPAHVLRFWESRFAQVKPVKRAGGRRYYRPADVALLGGIKKLLHEDGLTIRGVQKILREHGVKHVASFAGLAFDEPIAEPTDEFDQSAGIDEDIDQLMSESSVWPDAPSPEAAEPGDALLPDPEDTPAAENAPVNDLFSRGPAALSTRWDGPAPPRSSQTPNSLARAYLQKEREEQAKLTRTIDPGSYREVAPAIDAPIPAAAMLRAMTTYRAGERREELRAVYGRLVELHRKRAAEEETRSQ
ncbi:MAG: MerR family transcriptional regulator [Paracoccaceae bacterium]|mgnify:FL=1